MTNDQALSSQLWPHPFRWSNFTDVFTKAPLWRWALNTALYAGLATLGLLVSSIPVAYALSRLRWRGRDAVFLVTPGGRQRFTLRGLLDPQGVAGSTAATSS